MEALLILITDAVLLGVSLAFALALGHALWRDPQTQHKMRELKRLIISRLGGA